MDSTIIKEINKVLNEIKELKRVILVKLNN